MPTPVKTIGILTARAGKVEALKALLDGMLAPSRAEPGNLRYRCGATMSTQTALCWMSSTPTMGRSPRTPRRLTSKFYLAGIDDLAERSVFLLNSAQLG